MKRIFPLLCSSILTHTIYREHPYVFISRLAFKELLEAEGGPEKALPLVARIVPHIRTALRSPDKDTFQAGLNAFEYGFLRLHSLLLLIATLLGTCPMQ